MPKGNSSVAQRQGERRSGEEVQPLSPINDLLEYIRAYAQQKPEAAALWCLGIGFVLGWKLKFW